jgi:hypothetical protein
MAPIDLIAYSDHLPLYRQNVILQWEAAFEIERATLDGWVMRVPSSQKIGLLDCSLSHVETPLTYKAMAEAILDGDNRNNRGRIPDGMQSDRNASHANCNWSNKKTLQKPKDASQPYVPLPGFWLSGWGLCCRWLLQSVANCCKLLQESGSRLKLLQTVAICCNLLQNPKTCRFGVPMCSPRCLSR